MTRPAYSRWQAHRGHAAETHRPDNPHAFAREVRRLAQTGLTVQDIADALRVSPQFVVQLLASSPAGQIGSPI
jgi:hypothetical protein